MSRGPNYLLAGCASRGGLTASPARRVGSCALPLPGYDVRAMCAETGRELPRGQLGSLAIKLPLPPGAMTTLYENDERRARLEWSHRR